MRKFTFGLFLDLILKSKVALMIKDMDMSWFLVHIQQVKEQKMKHAEFGKGRARSPSLLNKVVGNNKVVGMTASSQ